MYQVYNPGIPLEAKFLDDEYQALYESEQRVSKLSKYFASVAIVYFMFRTFWSGVVYGRTKTKEIGIRKIFGCSEFRIIQMLSGDFTKMMLMSIAIALPVSYLIARKWLSNFAYRIDLEWWYFLGAALAVLFIAWFTVGLQTVKAARRSIQQKAFVTIKGISKNCLFNHLIPSLLLNEKDKGSF